MEENYFEKKLVEISTEEVFWDVFSDANNQFEAVRKNIQISELRKESEDSVLKNATVFLQQNPRISFEKHLVNRNMFLSSSLKDTKKLLIEEYNYLVERLNEAATLLEIENIIDSADMLKNKPSK